MSQAREALKLANAVRLARVGLKRDIKAGMVSVPEILLVDLPDWLEQMPVEELLMAVPRVGRTNARALARRAEVSPKRALCWVTPRQRLVLAEALESRSKINVRR